jgi:hypothetical protein
MMPIQAFVNNKNKIFIPKCEKIFQLWSKDTKYFTWNGKKYLPTMPNEKKIKL